MAAACDFGLESSRPHNTSAQEIRMSLHRMNSVTIGVPNVDDTRAFYRDFNLTETAPGVFASADGGEQLRIVPSPVRRVVEVSIGADDQDDLDRIASHLGAMNVSVQLDNASLKARDPGTGVDVRIALAPKLVQEPASSVAYNGPGRADRSGRSPRLPDDERPHRARPRKLGVVVI